MALEPNSGLYHLVIEVSRSYTIRHTRTRERARTHTHTYTHTLVRTHLEEAARRRGRYLIHTQQTKKTNFHVLIGIFFKTLSLLKTNLIVHLFLAQSLVVFTLR